MIKIRSYAVPKGSRNSSSSGSSGSGGGGAVVNTNVAQSDKWFYYNSDYDAVCCRYDFYSVGAVTANGKGDIEENVVEIVDNLNSTQQDAALSANQGRALKELIENLQTYVEQNFVRRT